MELDQHVDILDLMKKREKKNKYSFKTNPNQHQPTQPLFFSLQSLSSISLSLSLSLISQVLFEVASSKKESFKEERYLASSKNEERMDQENSQVFGLHQMKASNLHQDGNIVALPQTNERRKERPKPIEITSSTTTKEKKNCAQETKPKNKNRKNLKISALEKNRKRIFGNGFLFCSLFFGSFYSRIFCSLFSILRPSRSLIQRNEISGWFENVPFLFGVFFLSL